MHDKVQNVHWERGQRCQKGLSRGELAHRRRAERGVGLHARIKSHVTQRRGRRGDYCGDLNQRQRGDRGHQADGIGGVTTHTKRRKEKREDSRHAEAGAVQFIAERRKQRERHQAN